MEASRVPLPDRQAIGQLLVRLLHEFRVELAAPRADLGYGSGGTAQLPPNFEAKALVVRRSGTALVVGRIKDREPMAIFELTPAGRPDEAGLRQDDASLGCLWRCRAADGLGSAGAAGRRDDCSRRQRRRARTRHLTAPLQRRARA